VWVIFTRHQGSFCFNSSLTMCMSYFTQKVCVKLVFFAKIIKMFTKRNDITGFTMNSRGSSCVLMKWRHGISWASEAKDIILFTPANRNAQYMLGKVLFFIAINPFEFYKIILCSTKTPSKHMTGMDEMILLLCVWAEICMLVADSSNTSQ